MSSTEMSRVCIVILAKKTIDMSTNTICTNLHSSHTVFVFSLTWGS